jgi:hypothetical protein
MQWQVLSRAPGGRFRSQPGLCWIHGEASREEDNGKMRGYLARPAKAKGKLPAVLVIHENRGLNPPGSTTTPRRATTLRRPSSPGKGRWRT